MASATGKKSPKRLNPTLRGRMASIRRELGGLRDANGSADLFSATFEQLDALGTEIARATDCIMTACEAIQDAADGIADFASRYMPEVAAKLGDGAPPRLRWLPYDWTINALG